MKNLWPEQFEENTQPTAKSLMEEQARLLLKITGGLVYADVTDVNALEAYSWSMHNDFVFRFDIKGKFMESYRFHVLSFSHDITLYPVKFRIDEQVGKELGLTSAGSAFTTMVDNPEILELFVGDVLRSARVKKVVGSLLRLSK